MDGSRLHNKPSARRSWVGGASLHTTLAYGLFLAIVGAVAVFSASHRNVVWPGTRAIAVTDIAVAQPPPPPVVAAAEAFDVAVWTETQDMGCVDQFYQDPNAGTLEQCKERCLASVGTRRHQEFRCAHGFSWNAHFKHCRLPLLGGSPCTSGQHLGSSFFTVGGPLALPATFDAHAGAECAEPADELQDVELSHCRAACARRNGCAGGFSYHAAARRCRLPLAGSSSWRCASEPASGATVYRVTGRWTQRPAHTCQGDAAAVTTVQLPLAGCMQRCVEQDGGCSGGFAYFAPWGECRLPRPGAACRPQHDPLGAVAYAVKDEDDCAVAVTPCGNGGTCHDNGVLSFTCQCADGWSGPSCMEDVDECGSSFAKSICDAIASCVNTPGSFACECPAGFTGDGRSCVEIDECTVAAGVAASCGPNADCIDGLNAYSCKCHPGYADAGAGCSDLDECTAGLSDCAEHATCTNLPGSYHCSCDRGFSGDGKACENVDDCADGTHGCDVEHGDCHDGIDTYACECQAGWLGDGTRCVDEDECMAELNTCHDDAVCSNLPGDYACACNAGFSGDGHTCHNDDECALGTHDCDAHADCVDDRGSFHCTCAEGFDGTGRACSDVDECAADADACGAGATCDNTPGGFECGCGDGRLYDVHARTCVDVDECAQGTHACGAESGQCENFDGGYRCACNAGFATGASGPGCEDVDECATGAHNCPLDGTSTCRNERGGFGCGCMEGFALVGEGTDTPFCDDVDECASGSHDCPTERGSDCVNTDGGYHCQCRAGFMGEGALCIDNNECNMWPCHRHADCTNTPGSFQCVCRDGFTGDGMGCDDVDECAGGTDDCAARSAKCENTEGGFSCGCGSGFIAHGHGAELTCVDIDECIAGLDDCDTAVAFCLNTRGAYRCPCIADPQKTCGDSRGIPELSTEEGVPAWARSSDGAVTGARIVRHKMHRPLVMPER